MSAFTLAWLGWGVYFLVVETMALFNSRAGDTLSEHVWAWFGTLPGPNGQYRKASGWTQARRAALVMFMAWLTVHFLSGGWV